VRAFEKIARLGVIELREIHIPADGYEVLAVVLGVTARALALSASGFDLSRVKTPPCLEPLPDFGVTIQAPQITVRCLQAMTGGALSGGVERAVSLGQLAGRKLSPAATHGQNCEQ
jgi:hypothetical protein